MAMANMAMPRALDRTVIRYYQMEPFLDDYFKHMNNEVEEISFNVVRRLKLLLKVLYIKTERSLTTDPTDSSLECKLTALRESIKEDFDYCINAEGPLRDSKKSDYLRSLKVIVLQCLSVKELPNYLRQEYSRELCSFCEITEIDFLKWRTASERLI